MCTLRLRFMMNVVARTSHLHTCPRESAAASAAHRYDSKTNESVSAAGCSQYQSIHRVARLCAFFRTVTNNHVPPSTHSSRFQTPGMNLKFSSVSFTFLMRDGFVSRYQVSEMVSNEACVVGQSSLKRHNDLR